LSLAKVYADGGFLDAKWDVLRRHRTSAVSFEEWLLDRLPAGGRVLDVGAGSGRFAIPLAERGYQVVALDVLPDVMTPIRRSGLPIEIVVADVGAVPESLGRFDVVLAAHMLYHLDDIVAVAHALQQRVRPGGLFVATTNAAVGMRSMFELHLAAMRSLGLPVVDAPEPVKFFLENGADLLKKAFASVRLEKYDAGFTAPSADPVFAYYAATELYRAPMRDESLPIEARLRLAPTFVHLAQQAIDANGPLLVQKGMGAFFCTPQ
jgi:2-polyprenyl-3-methyl-5-hydroxy-6-metoxy-1,4-benzoquinol methylase